MSVRKLTAGLLTVLVMLGTIARANAQQRFENMPPADPFAFDPDFRWFEPVYDLDLMDMKSKHRAATGWFATYDRMYMYGSRPELNRPQHAESALDGGWGHRYALGYMNEKDHGWTFNWTEHDVRAGDYVRREAANRYNGGQVVNGSGGAGASDVFFGFSTPPFEANVQGSDYRFFDVGNTTNEVNFDSYELNKTWRMEPYHYGGILEPMIGIRWMRIEDNNRATRLNQFNDLTGIGTFVNTLGATAADQLLTDQSYTENEMFGGQIGFRYFKYRGRFTYSTDFRVFSGGSWQNARTNREELFILYDDGGTITIGDPPLVIQKNQTPQVNERNEEYFVGFDVRAGIGYQLTKMINIRAGFQLIDVANGVWRGGNPVNNITGGDKDQDLLLVGGTFGLELNH